MTRIEKQVAKAEAESSRCKQCGGEAELDRRNWATPVCYKCVPPQPNQGAQDD